MRVLHVRDLLSLSLPLSLKSKMVEVQMGSLPFASLAGLSPGMHRGRGEPEGRSAWRVSGVGLAGNMLSRAGSSAGTASRADQTWARPVTGRRPATPASNAGGNLVSDCGVDGGAARNTCMTRGAEVPDRDESSSAVFARVDSTSLASFTSTSDRQDDHDFKGADIIKCTPNARIISDLESPRPRRDLNILIGKPSTTVHHHHPPHHRAHHRRRRHRLHRHRRHHHR